MARVFWSRLGEDRERAAECLWFNIHLTAQKCPILDPELTSKEIVHIGESVTGWMLYLLPSSRPFQHEHRISRESSGALLGDSGAKAEELLADKLEDTAHTEHLGDFQGPPQHPVTSLATGKRNSTPQMGSGASNRHCLVHPPRAVGQTGCLSRVVPSLQCMYPGSREL